MKGVSGFFDAKTMGGGGSNTSASIASGLHHQQQHNYNNAAGHMTQDEEVFASSEVHTVGQVQPQSQLQVFLLTAQLPQAIGKPLPAARP